MDFRIPARYRLVVGIVAGLSLAAAIASIVLSELRDRQNATSLLGGSRSMGGLGRIAAEETSNLLGAKGKIMIVAPEPPTEEQRKALDGFRKRVGKVKGITIIMRNIPAPPPPPDPSGGSPFRAVSNKGIFSAGIFFDILKDHPDLNAIVSFAGPPNLNDVEIAGLALSTPKLVLITPDWNLDLVFKLMEEQVVWLAFLPRYNYPGAQEKRAPFQTEREQFEREFEIVTPETVASRNRS